MMIPSRKVNIGVMCLSKDDSNIVRGMLRFKKEIHDRIHLEVKCIDITKQLEMNGKGHCPDSNSRLASKIIQMVSSNINSIQGLTYP